jgi:long-chain fatty acid transport protein
MLKKTCIALALVLLVSSGLWANGLNLNGIGARACAMGGAFVGLADDYTAVFWNPAGLALIQKPTFGLTGELLLPSSTYGFTGFEMKTENKAYPAGILGYFTPISKKVVVGLGVYTPSGLGADWNNPGLEEAMIYPYPPAAFTPAVEAYRWRSFIGAITIAPSIAVKLSDMVSLGATININYGFFKTDQWGQYQVFLNPPKPPTLFNFGQATMDVDGWGVGATFGLLVKPSDKFSFGLSYRIQSKVKMSGTTTLENLPLLNPALPDSTPSKLDAINPMWLGGGIAVKPLANLTWTFDLQWTNWKKLDVLQVTFSDPAWLAAGETGNELELYWADKLQIRTGLEYVKGNLAFRAGYYYDPAPAPDDTMNILVPSFTYNSFQLGFGYKMGSSCLDFTVEYLAGQKRTITSETAAMPGIYTMNIWVPMLSFSHSF